jgi:hypothetical protein
MIRFLFYSLLTFIAASLHVLGQTETAESVETAPSKGRQAWIMSTSLPKDVESPIKVLSGNRLTEVKIMKRGLGLPVRVPTEGILEVVNPITNAEGKPAYERYASIKIPDGVNKALVILFPVSGLPTPLKFRTQVVDFEKFRGGDALFINLCQYDIGVMLGEKKSTLKPGQIVIMATGDFEGIKNSKTSYYYREAGQNTWNIISQSTTMLVSGRREILIFSYDHELGQIDYHGLTLPVLE